MVYFEIKLLIIGGYFAFRQGEKRTHRGSQGEYFQRSRFGWCRFIRHRFKVTLTDVSYFTDSNTNAKMLTEHAFAAAFVYNTAVVCLVQPDLLAARCSLETTQVGIFASTIFLQGTIPLVEGAAADRSGFAPEIYPQLDSCEHMTFDFSLVRGSVILFPADKLLELVVVRLLP